MGRRHEGVAHGHNVQKTEGGSAQRNERDTVAEVTKYVVVVSGTSLIQTPLEV